MQNSKENRKEMLCGIPFFRRHTDIQMFRKLGFACVYAVGPEKGRPLKIGWTNTPSGRFTDLQTGNWHTMKVHEIAWTVGPPLAKRLEKEVHRLLDKAERRIRGEWFDIPVEMALPTFQVAIDNLKIPTFTHDAMLERFEEARDLRAHNALKEFGALIQAA